MAPNTDFSTALFSPATATDPYPLFTAMREQAPVYRVEPQGWWALSRFADAAHVLRHHELFSSTTGLEQMRPPQGDERVWQAVAAMRRRTIVNLDPPEHTRLRRLISVMFTPQAIARLEARIRQISRELIDAIVERDEFEVMADLAAPLPIIVIAEVLGVDPGRRADFKRWSDDLVELTQVTRTRLVPEHTERLLTSRSELFAYLEAMIEARREAPHDDLLGDLVRAEVDEGRLSPEEVLVMAMVLLVAGNETTTHLIATGTHLLLDHPDALADLRADPSLVGNFLEEVLRHSGPVTMMFRRTTAEVTLSGTKIPPDTIVMPILGAANRDPAQFPDPDRFDIHREVRNHLGFGHGIHFCVGAPLSRLEGKIVFTELLRRLPALSRVDPQPDWRTNIGLRGLRSLKVRVG